MNCNRNWRTWPESRRLVANVIALLSRPNGRRMAAHLCEETSHLLQYKANRPGTWAKYHDRRQLCRREWLEIFGEQ